MGTAGARLDNGFAPWNAVNTDVQKATDKSTQNARDEIDERHLFFLMGSNFKIDQTIP
jgi:hypothetical protein